MLAAPARTGHPGARRAPADRRRLPTEGAIAHRLVSRFANHLAFYRQSQFLARCGMQIDRSTRADWSGSAAFLLSLQLPSCLMAFGGSRCKREPPPSPAFMPGGGGIRHRPVGARATAQGRATGPLAPSARCCCRLMQRQALCGQVDQGTALCDHARSQIASGTGGVLSAGSTAKRHQEGGIEGIPGSRAIDHLFHGFGRDS